MSKTTHPRHSASAMPGMSLAFLSFEHFFYDFSVHWPTGRIIPAWHIYLILGLVFSFSSTSTTSSIRYHSTSEKCRPKNSMMPSLSRFPWCSVLIGLGRFRSFDVIIQCLILQVDFMVTNDSQAPRRCRKRAPRGIR